MKSIQYTIRNIPLGVDKALRARAKARHTSFNQLLVETLRQGSGVDSPQPEYHDLDWFVGGGLLDGKAFDQALREQRVVDPDLWR
jgi:hypothetical protein